MILFDHYKSFNTMKGETRSLIAIEDFLRERDSSSSLQAPRRNPSPAFPESRLRSTPGPNDQTFFQSTRVRSRDRNLANPYRQHAYFHAATKRVASSFGSVPFRIFTESKTSANGSGLKDRSDAWKELCRRYRKIPYELFDLFTDHGKKEIRLKREFASTVVRLVPEAPLSLITKAVGVEVIEEGPWFDLFRDVNPMMTRSQLWEANTIYLNTDGECFWILFDQSGDFWEPPEKPPTTAAAQANFVPSQIWPFGKKGWEALVDEDSGLITGWKWTDPRTRRRAGAGTRKQKVFEFEVDQIPHYRFFDPEDYLGGLSPYEALDLELRTDHNAAKYNNGFFQKGAQLSGFVAYPNNLPDLQRQYFEEQFQEEHTGVDNMWKPGVFEGGGKWTPTGLSQRDMEFFKLREWVRDEVLSVIGTPKSELGVFTDVNRASALVSKRVFWENTIIPLIHYHEDLMDSKIFTPVTDGRVWGIFDLTQVEALREDLSDKAAVAEVFFKMGYPINMISERLEIGFEPVEWGNVGYLPKSLTPMIGDPAAEPPEEEPDPTDEPPDEETPDDDDEEDDGGGEGPGEGEPEDEEGSEDSEEESRPGGSRPPVGLKFVGEYDTKDKRDGKAIDVYERVMRPGEKKIKKFIRTLMVRMRAAALAAVGDSEFIGQVRTEDLLFNVNPFKDQLKEGIVPIFEEIFELATEEAEEELVEVGIVPLRDYSPIKVRQLDEFDFEISQLITSQAESIERIVDTVRNVVSDSLDKGIAVGATKAQLKDIVRGKFKILSGSFWTGRIAGTESALTTSAARELTFRRRQVPSNLWVNAGDDRVRDNHVTLDDGVPRPLGFNFGILLSGVPIMEFPLDPRAPADETINCRCALIPSQAPPRDPPKGGKGPSRVPKAPPPFKEEFVEPGSAHAATRRSMNGQDPTSTAGKKEMSRYRKADNWLQRFDDPEIQEFLKKYPKIAEKMNWTRNTQSAFRSFAKDKLVNKLATRIGNSKITNDQLTKALEDLYGPSLGNQARDFFKTGKGSRLVGKLDAYGSDTAIWNQDVINVSAREWATHELVNRSIHTWADTSANSNFISFTFQRGTKELMKSLKMKAPNVRHFSKNNAWKQSAETYAQNKAVIDEFVNGMYAETQSALAKAGITDVVLFRGYTNKAAWKKVSDQLMKDSLRPTGLIDPMVGTNAVAKLQPASSFSTNITVAEGFASYQEGGLVMSVHVPASRIIGSARTGWGCLSEGEFVLLGGDLNTRSMLNSLLQTVPSNLSP